MSWMVTVVLVCRAAPSRLLEIAPHYYDLSNFPKCEARSELEACLRRMHRL